MMSDDRTWIARAQAELNELSNRLMKLDLFLAKQTPAVIDARDRELLELQAHAMRTYEMALTFRLRRHGAGA